MIPLKHYVDVRVRFDAMGRMTPVEILWSDGRVFPIDRVLSVQNAYCEAGGAGRRYTVRIRGKERFLFYANDYAMDGTLRWFLESRKYYMRTNE